MVWFLNKYKSEKTFLKNSTFSHQSSYRPYGNMLSNIWAAFPGQKNKNLCILVLNVLYRNNLVLII